MILKRHDIYVTFDYPLVQLVDPTGQAVDSTEYSMPDTGTLRQAYAAMVIGREMNDQAGAMVRQGRLAVYPSSRGQEACQIASAHVLGNGDWLFPSYRDTVAAASRGIDPNQVLTLLRGDWHHGYDTAATRVAPLATPLATQLPHAVGVAHAEALRGTGCVVMALCGDGATSEGDFHEALNIAAVFKAPVVFMVQNNGYAISVPLSRQTAAPSLAHKAVGYGMPGERVDGNDIAAVLSVLTSAVARARSGEGPQLIEASTYRIEAHTNADDASRYRADEEVHAWRDRDPVRRAETYLRGSGALTDEDQARIEREAEDRARSMREFDDPAVDPQRLLEHVYSTPTQRLRDQAALLADEAART